MKYKLEKSTNIDIERLTKYKKIAVFDYAKDLSDEEVKKITKYIEDDIPVLVNYYQNIIIDNKKVGCLLFYNKDDGVYLDEIYLEEEYRNKGIGTDIIKNILKENNIVYLWVYKDNIKAVKLYKMLGFKVIEETDSRYYMKYKK